MQEASLEQATGKKDVILLSPTGSGKTLAYLLPLLLTLKTDDGSVQVLILVPSRELALQIDSVFKAMGTSWKTCCCYGGHPIAEEKKSILGNHWYSGTYHRSFVQGKLQSRNDPYTDY